MLRLQDVQLRTAIVALAACGGSAMHAQEPGVPPPPRDPAVRTVGPLAVTERGPQTSWHDLLSARRYYEAIKLDRDAMRQDIIAFEAMLDQFYVPRTPEQRDAIRYARQHDAILNSLAPYSIHNTAESLATTGHRLGICVRSPGIQAHCDHGYREKPASDGPPFEITEPAPGITQLSVRDLSNADDPAWATLDRTRLATAPALVVDLRFASGDDPRALQPLVEQLIGARHAALRAIYRHPSADTFSAAYRALFTDEGRDREVWSTLVGIEPATTTPPARTAPSKRSIAVVVGRQCGSACELAARMLETHAGAFLLGGVSTFGRLHRDEPALLTLPRSKIEVYFHTTEYLLTRAIEERTGPSHPWKALANDPVDFDALPSALAELTDRQPRCAAFPAYTSQRTMPRELVQKVDSEHELDRRHCSDGIRIVLHTKAPTAISTLRRFSATCTRPIEITSFGPLTDTFGIETRHGVPPYPVLTQLAQSDLVHSIEIDCVRRDDIDRRE